MARQRLMQLKMTLTHLSCVRLQSLFLTPSESNKPPHDRHPLKGFSRRRFPPPPPSVLSLTLVLQTDKGGFFASWRSSSNACAGIRMDLWKSSNRFMGIVELKFTSPTKTEASRLAVPPDLSPLSTPSCFHPEGLSTFFLLSQSGDSVRNVLAFVAPWPV